MARTKRSRMIRETKLRLAKISESFPSLKLMPTSAHDRAATLQYRAVSELINSPTKPVPIWAELESEIASLRGYLEAFRHLGWLRGNIGIAFSPSGVCLSGVIHLDLKPKQFAEFETMLYELNRRAGLLHRQNVAGQTYCAFEPV